MNSCCCTSVSTLAFASIVYSSWILSLLPQTGQRATLHDEVASHTEAATVFFGAGQLAEVSRHQEGGCCCHLHANDM